MTPPPAPRAPSAITPVSLARAVRRYALVFLLFVAAAAAAGAAVWFFLPLPHWAASVTYRVSAAPPGIVDPGALRPLDFVSYKQQQAAILHNRALMASVLADPAVANLSMFNPKETDDPVAWLIKNLQIGFSHGPEYMQLAVEGDDPVQLLTLLKALSAAYLKTSDARDRGSRVDQLEQLRKTQEQIDSKLRDSRGKITNAMKRLNATDPFTLLYRERFLEQLISQVESQLSNVTLSLKQLRASGSVNGLTSTAPAAAPELAPIVLDELVAVHPAMRALQTRKAALQQSLAQDNTKLVPGQPFPIVDRKRDELAKLEAEIKVLPAKLRPEIATTFQAEQVKLARQNVSTYNEKIAQYEQYQGDLNEEHQKLIAKRKDLNTISTEVKELTDDAAAVEAKSKQIAAAIEAIKPELDAPARVTLWEEPAVTPGIEGKRRAKYTAMAAGAVLLLGLALVQWLELRGRRVQTAEEVAHGTGLAVIGTVPFIPPGGGGDRDLFSHLLTEAINTTRTMILNPHAHPDVPHPRTILITSASSGEGKTSLATHLAVSLAGTGRRVLLIDADMRRPTAHAVLGVAGGPGLAEYLLGDARPDSFVTECRVPGLHFLPAGRWHPSAGAALNTLRWQDLLRDSAAAYDFVLIDSPPILPVADTLSIARGVDGVLFAVMRDWSRHASVTAACSRLQMVHARILGVVLSGAPVSRGHYHDTSYYQAVALDQAVAAG